MRKHYGGFIYNFTIYSVTMIIASLVPFLARTLASFFIKTPSIIELKANASYLFDVIYPIMGVVTLAAFLFGGYAACYISGYNIAYKARGRLPENKVKTQIIVCGVFIMFWNLFFGYGSEFGGFFGSHFWYISAIFGSLIGLFDKSNLLNTLTPNDLRLNNFVITGITPLIIWIIILFSIIITGFFVYLSFKGRVKGEADGLAAKEKDVEKLKNSDTSIR